MCLHTAMTTSPYCTPWVKFMKIFSSRITIGSFYGVLIIYGDSNICLDYISVCWFLSWLIFSLLVNFLHLVAQSNYHPLLFVIKSQVNAFIFSISFITVSPLSLSNFSISFLTDPHLLDPLDNRIPRQNTQSLVHI